MARQRANVFERAYIARLCRGLYAHTPQLLGDTLHLGHRSYMHFARRSIALRTKIRDNNIHAIFCQAFCNRFAEPAAPTGSRDNGGFSLEEFYQSLLVWIKAMSLANLVWNSVAWAVMASELTSAPNFSMSLISRI